MWKLAASRIFFASSIESFCFLGPGFFFLFNQGDLSRFDFSPYMIVSCVSWPSKEDIASHMALTQLHRLQIDGELNIRKSEYTGMYSRAKLHGMSKMLC